MSTAPLSRAQRLERLAADLAQIGLGTATGGGEGGGGEGSPLLSPTAHSRLLDYAELLQRWNARIRLVGPLDLDTIVREQLVDACGFALAVAALDAPRIVDVGAGGGLPGVPLAIFFPDRELLLVEPIHKKTAFLAHAAQQLGLTNLRVHTGRAEPDGKLVPALRQPALSPPTLALSRATLAPAPWLATARHLVGPGGLVLVALAAEDTLPPEVAGDPDSSEIARFTYRVPATDAPRTLIARRVGSSRI